MPLLSTVGAGSINGFKSGSIGLYPFTTYTFTSAKTPPVGAGSFYVGTYIGDGQKLIVPRTGTYHFKTVSISGAYVRPIIECDYTLIQGDILMAVIGTFAPTTYSNGYGGDMTGIAVYRSTPGIWGNYEPIVVSGGGGSSGSIGTIVTSATAITSYGAGGVDGDSGASWTTRSYPRNGGYGFAGYPFIMGYGGGGCAGQDGDGDGATGGGGGYSSGHGGTSYGNPGSSCYNVNATNVNIANTEATSNPYVVMTFLS
jgi:hypothetical protein